MEISQLLLLPEKKIYKNEINLNELKLIKFSPPYVVVVVVCDKIFSLCFSSLNCCCWGANFTQTIFFPLNSKSLYISPYSIWSDWMISYFTHVVLSGKTWRTGWLDMRTFRVANWTCWPPCWPPCCWMVICWPNWSPFCCCACACDWSTFRN